MGKNNRQRRKHKSKARERNRAKGRSQGRAGGRGASHDHPPSLHHPPSYSSDEIELLFRSLVASPPDSLEGDPKFHLLAQLNPKAVYPVIEALFDAQISWLWRQHWLPGEIIRHVRRSSTPRHANLMAAAVAADHARHDSDSIHPLWAAHVDSLDLAESTTTRWFGKFARSAAMTYRSAIEAAIIVLRCADVAAGLSEIIPPPNSKKATEASILDARDPAAGPVLAKVRNLLAQAESTNYDAEADAFTAKAQELMARHSLDEAVVWARSDDAERPGATRIAIDDPYAKPKVLLLSVVASASNCRSIQLTGLGLVTVIGFEADLRAAETLFTSLLLQAQRSLQRAAATAPPGARTRSRGYRTSFLLAFGRRIGERLTEINDHVRKEAVEEGSHELLPVLASRSMAIDDEVDRRFGDLESIRFGFGSDYAGAVAGRFAADQAELAKAVADD